MTTNPPTFSMLVRTHGPVLRAARRRLDDVREDADADDEQQAYVEAIDAVASRLRPADARAILDTLEPRLVAAATHNARVWGRSGAAVRVAHAVELIGTPWWRSGSGR